MTYRDFKQGGRKGGKVSACLSKTKSIDGFGDQFKFLLPGAEQEQKTFSGCIVSLCAILILIFYGTLQYQRLIGF